MRVRACGRGTRLAATRETCVERGMGYEDSETGCAKCGRGKYRNDKMSKCEDCLPGLYGTKEGLIECDGTCPNDGSSPPGSDSASNCTFECGEGTFRSSSTTCYACPSGRYKANTPSNDYPTCVDCKAGTYKEQEGAEAECDKCDADTYGTVVGATSPSDCHPCASEKTTGTAENGDPVRAANASSMCRCKAGTYYVSGYEESDSTEDDTIPTTVCSACPEGADCSLQDDLPLQLMRATSGYWRPSPTSELVLDCADAYRGIHAETLATERCCNEKAGSNCTTTTGWSDPNIQCAHGYSGIMCSGCSLEHVAAGNVCVICPQGSSLGFAILSTFTIHILGFAFTLWMLSRQVRMTMHARRAGRVMGQIKITITHMQILSSMLFVMNGIPWPSSFENFATALSVVNLNVFQLFSGAACEINVHHLDQFFVSMSVPPVLCVCQYLTLPIIMAWHKHRDAPTKQQYSSRWELRRRTMAKVAVFLYLLQYPGLCGKIFSMFRCQHVLDPDGQTTSRLMNHLDVVCWEGAHARTASAAFAFGAVYIFGVPFLLFVIMHRNKQALFDEYHPLHRHVRFQYGGLYMLFENKFWWFQAVVIAHKMVMTGALSVMAPGTAVQPLLAVLFMLAYLLVLLKTTPFEYDADDFSAYTSATVLLLASLMALALRQDTDKEYDQEAMGWMLILLSSAWMLWQLWTIYNLQHTSKKKDEDRLWNRVDASPHLAVRKVRSVNRAIRNTAVIPKPTNTNPGIGAERSFEMTGRSKFVRGRLMANIHLAMAHHTARSIGITHGESRNRRDLKIRRSEIVAKARVQKRLAQRQLQKTVSQGGMGGGERKTVSTTSADTSLETAYLTERSVAPVITDESTERRIKSMHEDLVPSLVAVHGPSKFKQSVLLDALRVHTVLVAQLNSENENAAKLLSDDSFAGIGKDKFKTLVRQIANETPPVSQRTAYCLWEMAWVVAVPDEPAPTDEDELDLDALRTMFLLVPKVNAAAARQTDKLGKPKKKKKHKPKKHATNKKHGKTKTKTKKTTTKATKTKTKKKKKTKKTEETPSSVY